MCVSVVEVFEPFAELDAAGIVAFELELFVYERNDFAGEEASFSARRGRERNLIRRSGRPLRV